LFFETTDTSQSAGRQFVERLARRTQDKDTLMHLRLIRSQLANVS